MWSMLPLVFSGLGQPNLLFSALQQPIFHNYFGHSSFPAGVTKWTSLSYSLCSGFQPILDSFLRTLSTMCPLLVAQSTSKSQFLGYIPGGTAQLRSQHCNLQIFKYWKPIRYMLLALLLNGNTCSLAIAPTSRTEEVYICDAYGRWQNPTWSCVLQVLISSSTLKHPIRRSWMVRIPLQI